MKVYVIYRIYTDDEYTQAIEASNDDTHEIKRKNVYAFTRNKNIAEKFMSIHSKKKFKLKKEKLSEEEYYEFIVANRDKDLTIKHLRDRKGFYDVAMTEDEDSFIMSEFYDVIMADMNDIVLPIPSCKIFKEKYQRVLDLLGVSHSVYSNKIDMDEYGSITGDTLIMTGTGECGFEAATLDCNTLNVYCELYSDILDDGGK